MAKRRDPIRFNELEPRGRGAIVRTRAEIEAEEVLLANQLSGNAESQHGARPATQTFGLPDSESGSERANRTLYEKVTYRISPEAVEAIDEIKRLMKRIHGIKVTREEIAEAAFLEALRDFQENQERSFLAGRLSRKPEI